MISRSRRGKGGPMAATCVSRGAVIRGALRRRPIERSEMRVVAALRIVPVDAESVHPAPRAARERKARVRRMAGIVDVDRLAGSRQALDALAMLLEHARHL